MFALLKHLHVYFYKLIYYVFNRRDDTHAEGERSDLGDDDDDNDDDDNDEMKLEHFFTGLN